MVNSNDESHRHKVRQQLGKAGMTTYGFLKLEARYVPQLIHVNENIEAVVYGRLENTVDSVMLIATDQRVLFIDCKPFLKNHDEITYEVVAGVKMTSVGPFAGIELHTRVKDYTLRFVNLRCAHKFVEYIEGHIEKEKGALKITTNLEGGKKKTSFQPYRMTHAEKSTHDEYSELPNTAVFSSIDKDGNVHGSIVHYLTDKDENYYIATKTHTNKAQNIAGHNKVALTIHRANSLKYLQVRGTAEVVNDNEISKMVIDQITSPKNYIEGNKFPPVTKNTEGKFIVFKIIPTESELNDFSKTNW